MLTNTSFLPGFSTLLSGRCKRSPQAVLEARREESSGQCLDGLSQQLESEISSELLDRHNATQRERIYSTKVTFWAFLGQVLSEDSSCARAVARVQSWMKAAGRPTPSAATTSYVDARQALPTALLRDIHNSLCDQLDSIMPNSCKWRGFNVKSEDGTSAQMPDTAANQEAYPQPNSQASGCGFPTIKLVGLIDLGHGGLRDFSESMIDTSELRGHDLLEDYLEPGDLLVADRLYSSFELIARLQAKGVEFVGRNHQSRKVDFRKGKKIGPDERIIEWRKPFQPPGSQLTREQWDTLPDRLELRIIRSKITNREGKKQVCYFVSTLLDAVAYPCDEVASLYVHRWEIEVRLRDIKTTMGMELLRTKTPEMIRKEVLMHMIAYNAIRLLMLKAAIGCGKSPRRISFKGVIQVLEENRHGFRDVAGKPRRTTLLKENLFRRIAERIIPDRPGRHEPRKKKRRPKSYGWLQQPRHSYFTHYRNPDPPMKILDQLA